MNKTDKEALREKITQLLKEGEESMILLKKNTQPISPENSIGRISRMDAINNKSVAEASLRNLKKKLSKLKLALSNLDKKDFGLCSYCHQSIQIKRIMYLPESTLCIRCAAKR